MLTGVHPFDLQNTGDDDEVVRLVISRKPPPLRNSSITAHLSDSAIEIIEQLMMPDPEKRITAQEALDHPWVKGKTASRRKISGSDKKLSMRLQAKVFEKIVDWSDSDMEAVARKASLVELAFREFYPSHQADGSSEYHEDNLEQPPLSLSSFSDLLSENMKNKYFPKGHVREDRYVRGDSVLEK
jgi:serine/threonine protein kinase